MKKNVKVLLTVVAVCAGCMVFAGPPRHGGHAHHHKRDGLDLAYGIVDLVMRVVAPQPVVVAPAPVVVTQPPPVVVVQQPRYYQYRQAPPPPPPRHHGGGYRR